jgi:hypothetical protein
MPRFTLKTLLVAMLALALIVAAATSVVAVLMNVCHVRDRRYQAAIERPAR